LGGAVSWDEARGRETASGVNARPDYGVDAPGVVLGFFGAAFALGNAGWAGVALLDAPWIWLSIPAFLVATVALLLGLSMLLYAYLGKQRLRDHLLRQRSWRGDEVVLDLGAGRGLMAVGAAKRAPHGRIIALDVWSAKDLTGNTPDSLRRNATIERVRNVEIVTGDARRLDIPDASVDAVVSVFCIHNIQPAAERLLALREIARVLKPSGSAMIADFPGVGAYVGPLRAAGLRVEGPLRSEKIGLGICGYLVAWK